MELPSGVYRDAEDERSTDRPAQVGARLHYVSPSVGRHNSQVDWQDKALTEPRMPV